MSRITFLLLLMGIQFLYSQKNLDTGFAMLETGDFAKAESFFGDYLKSSPDDFTAQICYGRAIGLNNSPEKALELFDRMRKENPENLEIDLNYAEALLWNKQFEQAEIFYSHLNQSNPDNTKILLGLANTYSNLKKYESANNTIQEALILEPYNPGLLNSRKYINLGWAYQLTQDNQIDAAKKLLYNNQKLFPDDIDTYKSLFNIYLQENDLESAENLINNFKNEDYTMQQLQWIQKSLLAHLNHLENTALKYAKNAFQAIDSITNYDYRNAAVERYIQALIWNKKFTEAASILEKHKTEISQKQYSGLQMQLESYKANFGAVNDLANQSLKNDSLSFDAVMNKLNAFLGAKDYDSAQNQLAIAENLFPGKKEVIFIKEKMQRLLRPSVSSKTFLTEDNGNNNSYNFTANLRYPLNYKIQLKTGFNYRKTVDFNQTKANNTNFYFGGEWMVSPKWKLDAQINRYQSKSETDFYKWFPNASISYQLHALSNIEVGYNQAPENFNTQLAESQLLTKNIFTNLNLYTNYRIGLYSQLMTSNYSDGNRRNLLYSSLYYTLGNKPVFKFALNYQNMQFSEQLPSLYFSPNRFSLVEGMMVIESPIYEDKEKQWLYLLNVGIGSQKIERNKSQITSRIIAEFGYKFSSVSILKIYGGYTNIASSSAAGFALKELGLIFNYSL